MGTKRITDLTTVTSVLDAQYFPIDDGIQSYKASSSQIATYMATKLAPAATGIKSKTTTYALLDTDRIILASTAGGAWSLTIPAASATNQDTIYRIQKTTADYYVLSLIGGLTTTLDTIGEYIEIANNGTTWYLLNRGGIAGVLLATTTVRILGSTTNPTKGSGITDTAAWYRNGSKLQCLWTYVQTGAGSAGSGAYVMDAIPNGSGLAVDTTNIPATGSVGSDFFWPVIGAAYLQYGGGYHRSVAFYGTDNAKSGVEIAGEDGGNCFGSGFGSLGTASVFCSASWELPIVGWKA